MRNDDPMYVKHLESALEAAELEIKGLEGELREQDKVLQQMQEQLSPTFMGEPLITKPRVGAGGTANLCSQIRSAQIAAGEDAVTANLRGMGLLPANVEVTGAARLHRAASSDRRERGRLPGWATYHYKP